MAFHDKIKHRAIELSKGHNSAGNVLRELIRESPHDALPNERTIRRWRKAKPVVLTDEHQIKASSNDSGNWKVHYDPLTSVANSLIADGLENVSHPGWTTNQSQKEIYLIPNENAPSGYDELTREELSEKLNQNIKAVRKQKEWFFRYRFVPYVKKELPKELRTWLFNKIIEEEPYQLIDVLRKIAYG